MDPTNTSVIPPPPGTESNFINPVDQLAAVYVTSALVLTLPVIGVSARLYVKLFVAPGHRTEDYLSYFALATFIPYVAVIIHLFGMGITHHLYDITVAHMTDLLYWTNIVYCIYAIPTAAAKLSVLFQLKSIFTTGARNVVYWVIVASIVINAIFYTSLFFAYVFECWPREKIWLGSTVAGRCTDSSQVNLSSGVLNIISDVEALLIPTWAIWHLSMPVKRKLAALSVFAVSLVAIGTGIGGIYIRIRLLTDVDQTWWLTKLALIATSEISIVIFVGCMPSLSRLYRHLSGPTPSADSSAKYSAGPGAFGSSKKTGRSRQGGGLHSLAKYMGPNGAGMTTLGSQGGSDHEDEFELRKHVASTASASVDLPMSYARREDLESGGRAVAYNPSNTQNHILKTSQVKQTYGWRPEDD